MGHPNPEDFQKKRRVMLSVIDKVVASESEVHVYGYLPVTEADYVKYTSESRDCGVGECGEVDIV